MTNYMTNSMTNVMTNLHVQYTVSQSDTTSRTRDIQYSISRLDCEEVSSSRGRVINVMSL